MSEAKQPAMSRHSQQFCEYIGHANMKRPENHTAVELLYIQQAFVEAYCIATDKHSPLPWVPETARLNEVGQSVGQPAPVGKHFTYFTTQRNLNKPIETFVELYCHACICDFRSAVETLANRYELSPLHLFGNEESISKSTQRLSWQGGYPELSFPQPPIINTGESIYSQSNAPIVFNVPPTGFTLNVMRYCSNDGTEIHIPLHPAKNVINNLNDQGYQQDAKVIKYGPGGGELPLYNLNFIDKLNATAASGDATVFLCEDLRVAVELSGIILDSRRLGHNQYIATGWYGGNRLVECVNFKPLWNKKIIFIPAIRRFSYANIAETVKNACLAAEVKEFRIYKPAVVKIPPCKENSLLVNEINDPWERYLAKSLVSLSECESFVVKKIAENAVVWDDYRHWGEHMGLFMPSNEAEAVKSGLRYTHTHTVSQLRDNFSLEPNTGLKLDCFGAFENMAVLYGRRYSAKSMLALTVAIGRASGQGFLNFEALPPSRVLYVDGETSGQNFRERLERITSAFNCNMDFVEANFYTALLRADHQLSDIDLENENQQNEIVNLIRQYKPELIVFDNLQSLLGGFRSNNATTAWKAFYEWLLSLEKTYQTGFLIVHHDNDDGGPAGTKKIANLCGTEICIMGKESLKEELKKSDHPHDLEMYKPYLEKHGALFRAEIKKSKFYGAVETAPFGAFLSISSPTTSNLRRTYGLPWQAIGNVIPLRYQEMLAGDRETLMAELKAKYPDRTDDEYKILGHLIVNKTITNKDICSLLMTSKGKPCSRSTATKRIRPLKDCGIIDLLGSGPSSYYQLREVADVTGEEAV